MNAKNRKRTTKSIGGKGWADLFGSRAPAQLMTTFLTHRQQEFYQKELADTAEPGFCAVQRELVRSEKADLVSRMPRENRL